MAYHWCRECAYRPYGRIEHVKRGRKEYIEFFCPRDGEREHGTLYHKADFDAYKISCPRWEPYQMSIFRKGEEDGQQG